MADPFIGEIRIFPFNFAPKGWAWCNGQLLPISQNTALFSLLGTTYGGDGKSNFALPDLQGRAPMHPEQGPGLSLHYLGEIGGSKTVTLLASEIPAHSHSMQYGDSTVPQSNPSDALPTTSRGRRSGMVYAEVAADKAMHPESLTIGGGSQPHNNMQPYLTFYFAIAMQGVFPQRG